MSAALGFGPIKDDDEFLDRLGARRSESTQGLEGLLAAWTAGIDEDELAFSGATGPWGLRRGTDLPHGGDAESADVPADPDVKVLSVPRSRAVALVGALALTLSGGGVAAAMNSTELHPVRAAIERAARPAAVVAGSAVSPTAVPGAPSDATTAAAMAMVGRAQDAWRNGEVDRARGMLEAIRGLLPLSGAGSDVTAQVVALEQQLGAPPADVSQSPGSAAQRPTGEVAPAPAVPSDSPTVAPPQGPVAQAPATATSPTPASSAPTAPTTTPPASTSPSTPGGTDLGHAGSPVMPGRPTPAPSDPPRETPSDESPRDEAPPTRDEPRAPSAPRPTSGASERPSPRETARSDGSVSAEPSSQGGSVRSEASSVHAGASN